MLSEKKIEVVKVYLYCDKCKGKMKHTGQNLMSNPAQYPHFCEECGYRVTYHTIYPCLKYIEID